MENNVYSQRATLAVALAWMTIRAGGKAGRGRDSDQQSGFCDVIYIETPDGDQLSYHFSPTDAHMLDGLPDYAEGWDELYTGRESWWLKQYRVSTPAEKSWDVAQRRLSGFTMARWNIERRKLITDSDILPEVAEAILLGYAKRWPGVDTL